MNIPLVKVPTFKMKLPLSDVEVTYRPYVVKEEKILIMANESKDVHSIIDAMCDIVTSCTFGVIDAANSPLFEVQYAFLQIRGKSQGETLEFYSGCGSCKDQKRVEVDVSEFTLQETPEHSKKIELPDSVHVLMRYPTLKLFHDLYEAKDENIIYDVVAKCIDSVYTADETFKNNSEADLEDFRNFIDNMTPEQFERFEKFFVTMPVLLYSITYPCDKCGTPNVLTVNGVDHFFG